MQREGCRERERENRLERSIKQIAVRSIKKVEQVGCVCVYVCHLVGQDGTRPNKKNLRWMPSNRSNSDVKGGEG